MKRYCKIIISTITIALILTLSFPIASYAITPQQFGAWVAAALSAISITVNSTITPAIRGAYDVVDWLSQPEYIIANQFYPVDYTTDLGEIDTYLSRSVLKIDKDKVTIDGVDYTDVWLSTDAAEQFRVDAFDIENAFDIASQSEGTFVSGVGKVDNIRIYQLDNNKRSQNFALSGVYGDYYIGKYLLRYQLDGTYGYIFSYHDGVLGGTASLGNVKMGQSASPFKYPISTYLNIQNQNVPAFINTIYNENNQTTSTVGVIAGGTYVEEPFQFDWVAGTIPPDQVLPNDEGLRIRVPTNDIEQWYEDYPGTGDNITINMGDPELEAKVDDLIDLIIPLIPILDIDFERYEQPAPQPEPEPVPDPEPYPDPLPDPSISLIDSTLKDIVQALKNLYDNISIGNSISEAIKNLSDKIKWTLDDIKEAIGDLTGRIVSGNADWFRDIVESIWQPFLPIFNIFKAGLGIWRYVVEWFEFISTPFIFFWNALGNASYYARTPFYALAAASIVIAIYRRFGR